LGGGPQMRQSAFNQNFPVDGTVAKKPPQLHVLTVQNIGLYILK
jgi:hypothetical protein